MQHYLRNAILLGILAGLVANHPSAGVAAEILPAKVDLAPEYERLGILPQLQGDRDVCSLFAVTGVADFESARHSSGPQPRLSEEFLIWAAKVATGKTREQAMFYEAVHGLNARGICDRSLMPYVASSDAQRQPSHQAIADAKPRAERWQAHWIRLWDVSRPMSEPQFLGLKRALAGGHPVACGLRWPKSLKGSAILSDNPPGGVFDGHSIVLTGYADDPSSPGGGTYRFRNSFGPQWGEHGYGRMSYAYARKYANDALWLGFGQPGSERPVERFEAESLPIVERRNCEANPQGMGDFEGRLWSRGRQLFCMAKRGGSVELAFDVHQAGRYRVRLLATAAPDYGEIVVALDGVAAGTAFDLYAGRVCPAGSLELGRHDLAAGKHRLRYSVIRKNPASSNFFFGLDAIDLLAIP
jgi:hypothetical protein